MVAAGWCFDPSPEYDDGASCFYCGLSLDGWEPKDDPMYVNLATMHGRFADLITGKSIESDHLTVISFIYWRNMLAHAKPGVARKDEVLQPPKRPDYLLNQI